jgi:hypothetical protein
MPAHLLVGNCSRQTKAIPTSSRCGTSREVGDTSDWWQSFLSGSDTLWLDHDASADRQSGSKNGSTSNSRLDCIPTLTPLTSLFDRRLESCVTPGAFVAREKAQNENAAAPS